MHMASVAPLLAMVEPGTVALIVLALLVMAFLSIGMIAWRLKKVPPNQALIVVGSKRTYTLPNGRVQERNFRIVKGGRVFVWPLIQESYPLSLEIMTIDFKTPEVYSVNAIPVVINGVAQIKVKGDDSSIATAAEQFLSKSRDEMQHVALETLEGHIRAIIGTLTVEDMYRDRERFAQKVQEVSATDFANMGLEVVSLTMKEVNDTRGYLEALGKPREAEVKRDAIVAQAIRDREATQESAKNQQQAQAAKFEAETKIAEAKRDFEMRQAEYQAQVNQKRAEADLAYDLQKFQVQQQVKAEEVRVLAVEKERMIEVQEKEVQRKAKELEATVEKPAVAEQKRIMTIADANRYQIEAQAEAEARARKSIGTGEAEAIRAKGLAEAEVVKAKGVAEAEAMRQKAEAWKFYNEAAMAQMFIEKLPEVVRGISEPLSKVEKIVMISGNGSDGVGASRITQDVLNIASQLPPVLEALSGVSLKDLLGKVAKKGGGDSTQK